jgi:SnoaL-like domain
MDGRAFFDELYEACNRRDIDAVLAMMNGEVDWPNAWKGGRLNGREAVRAYWTAHGPRLTLESNRSR